MHHGDPHADRLGPDERREILSLLAQAVEDGHIPGASLLLARGDETLLRESVGWADVEARRPLTPDDAMWIGACTIPIAATCVVKLAAEGTINLDLPIQGYLPEFRGIRLRGGTAPSSLPTTRQLLAHTSGIMAAAAWSVFWADDGDLDPAVPPPAQAAADRRVLAGALASTLSEQVRRTALYRLAAEPGTLFDCSSAAFAVAGRVAEVASGRPFDELLAATVLAPTGMQRTGFDPPPDGLADMPLTYRHGPAGLQPVPRPAPAHGIRRLVLVAGGLASTPDDCAAFLSSNLNPAGGGPRPVLSARWIAEMHTNHTGIADGTDAATGYGLGWRLERLTFDGEARTVCHDDSNGSLLWIDLDRDLVGVFLAQVQPAPPAVRQLTGRIQDIARQAIPPADDGF